MDMDFIFAEFKKTKHPLVPTVRGLEKACDNNLGEYVHFGVTTQDISLTQDLFCNLKKL